MMSDTILSQEPIADAATAAVPSMATRGGPDPALLIRRAGELLDAGRPGAVRPMLAALERLGAPVGELALLQAGLAVQEGRLEAACSTLDAGLERSPDHAALRKARADVRFRLKLTIGAAQDAAEAVILDPRDAQAKAQLGAILLALGRATDARACLAEAVAAQPLNPTYRETLAAAEEADGDPDAALATLQAGIATMPRAVSLRRAAVRQWLHLGNAEAAAAVAAAARREGVIDSGLLALTGQALMLLDLTEPAMEAFAEAAKLDPEDPMLRRILEGRAKGLGSRAPDDPVRIRAEAEASALWSEHRAFAAGDRVPGLMRAALLRHLPALRAPTSKGPAIGPALDLGCGTGLVGVALSDLPVAPLIGIDLSPSMLARAKTKSIYTELYEADMLAFLAGQQRRFAVIVAAGVLQGVPDLRAFFVHAARCLARGGLFLVSTERMRDGLREWPSDSSGFSHSAESIRLAANTAGLELLEQEDVVIRCKGGSAVGGLLAVMAQRGSQ